METRMICDPLPSERVVLRFLSRHRLNVIQALRISLEAEFGLSRYLAHVVINRAVGAGLIEIDADGIVRIVGREVVVA